MRRFGQLIRIKKEKLDYYKSLHANPWPCVLKKIKDCNIQNYSIFLSPNNELFAYFEYIGNDFNLDMKRMASDKCIQKWWKETDPCQESLDKTGKNWWLNLEEVFHI